MRRLFACRSGGDESGAKMSIVSRLVGEAEGWVSLAVTADVGHAAAAERRVCLTDGGSS